MAAPSVLVIAGLSSQGTMGHYVRIGGLAVLIFLVVSAVVGVVWANTWPKDAKEKLKLLQAQKMAEQPEPRVASRNPQV